jgi:hypothetical protein
LGAKVIALHRVALRYALATNLIKQSGKWSLCRASWTLVPHGRTFLQGTFNPEIFTPLLSAVLGFYAGKVSGLHAMYTDAKHFFGEATYPTDGLKMVVSEVFARIAGDNSVPAIHRMETAFGGGKTHALIACAHIGHRGDKLAEFARICRTRMKN